MSSEVELLRQQLAAAEERLSASQQQLSISRQRSSKTDLPTFLDGLHKHLFLNLEIQTDETQSTRGDPSNARNKLRPRKLRAWESFPLEQEKIWRLLMESSLVKDELFTSLHTLEEMGENVRRQLIGSELDLNHFLRQTVEDHVSRIVEELYKDTQLRQTFGLKGSIRFENHSNTLSPDDELQESFQSMNIRGRSERRRSPRIAARENRSSSAQESGPKASRPPMKRPRADQYCVYNIPSESSESVHRVAAYIKEYKSPHKVSLGHIYEGLGDIDVDDLVIRKDDEAPKIRFQRALLALLSQPYDYMLRAMRPVAVLSTGETDIYLRISDDDPSTLLYHLSVPKGDVGVDTGWDPNSSSPNRLHLTAVGQSLAFTLQALKLPSRSQAWSVNTINKLPIWEVIPAELLDEIPEHEVPSSEYRPAKFLDFTRSPIQLRHTRRKSTHSSCRISLPDGSSDEENDPDTPSRGPHSHSSIERKQMSTNASSPTHSKAGSFSEDNHRRYCTLKCLRGLVHGGELDMACPNVRDHGKTHHVITGHSFLRKLRQQLTETINADCETLGIHGSRGALLKVTLSSHGYTMPAKCTVREFREQLRHEAFIYNRLTSIQGVYVPLHLGSIDLVHPYSYDGIAYLEHMMLLSPGGISFDAAIRDIGKAALIPKLMESLTAIHDEGIIQKDPAPRNWRYNPEIGQVVIFDFERAESVKLRSVLAVISANRKRKRSQNCEPKGKFVSSEFGQEVEKAVHELRYLGVRR
ncbi:hypothetical protein VI817_007918 [Penicillium citrinum]|nr:hypothetical protein VI817_007918 [Penicillium citrinum]